MSKRILCLLLLLQVTGCSSLKRGWEKTASKWLLPVNIVAGYFGAIALHEGGHAITGELLGADDIHVDVLPTKDSNGVSHLGLTSYSGEFSATNRTLLRTMGPTAAFAGHVLGRELLRAEVPKIIQPTIAWFELFNHIGFYYHVLNGIGRNRNTDLGKEDEWISWTMLAGVALYDLFDILLDGSSVLKGLERRFAVLFGEKFYEPKSTRRNLKLLVAPTKGGGFLGIGFDW